MSEDATIGASLIAVVLLCLSQAAGVLQFLRSQHAVSLLREFKPTFTVLLVGWVLLLTFISFRLAVALELV